MAINVLRGFAQQAVRSGINNAANSIRSGLMSSLNGNLPSNKSSTALLQHPSGKFTTKNLRFPIDVEGPPGTGNQGHYIMFFINKQADATIRFGSPDKTYEGNKNIQKAMAENKTTNSGHLIIDATDPDEDRNIGSSISQKNKELSTTMLQRPATIRTDTGIALYMPPSVQVQYGADYQDTEIGSGTAIVSNAYSQIQAGKSTTDAVVAGILHLVKKQKMKQ